MKTIYYILLSTFILRVVFTVFPFDGPSNDWHPLSTQVTTLQFLLWRLSTFLIEVLFLVVLMKSALQTEASSRLHLHTMASILLWIQAWYILEYFLHYNSIWITWEQLGLKGNGRTGLSSHIVTMLLFAYFGYKHD